MRVFRGFCPVLVHISVGGGCCCYISLVCACFVLYFRRCACFCVIFAVFDPFSPSVLCYISGKVWFLRDFCQFLTLFDPSFCSIFLILCDFMRVLPHFWPIFDAIFVPYFRFVLKKCAKITFFTPIFCTIFLKVCQKVRKMTCFHPRIVPYFVPYFYFSRDFCAKTCNFPPISCLFSFHISKMRDNFVQFRAILPLDLVHISCEGAQ